MDRCKDASCDWYLDRVRARSGTISVIRASIASIWSYITAPMFLVTGTIDVTAIPSIGVTSAIHL